MSFFKRWGGKKPTSTASTPRSAPPSRPHPAHLKHKPGQAHPSASPQGSPAASHKSASSAPAAAASSAQRAPKPPQGHEAAAAASSGVASSSSGGGGGFGFISNGGEGGAQQEQSPPDAGGGLSFGMGDGGGGMGGMFAGLSLANDDEVGGAADASPAGGSSAAAPPPEDTSAAAPGGGGGGGFSFISSDQSQTLSASPGDAFSDLGIAPSADARPVVLGEELTKQDPSEDAPSGGFGFISNASGGAPASTSESVHSGSAAGSGHQGDDTLSETHGGAGSTLSFLGGGGSGEASVAAAASLSPSDDNVVLSDHSSTAAAAGSVASDDVAPLDVVSDERPATRQQRVFTDASTGSLGVMSLLNDVTSSHKSSPNAFDENRQQGAAFDDLHHSSPFGISMSSSSNASPKQARKHLSSTANHSTSSSMDIPADIYKVETPPVVVDNSIHGRMKAKAREFRQMNLEYWRNLQAIAVDQSDIEERKNHLKSSLRDAESKLQQAVAAQQLAIDREDFDEADRLNAEIQSCERRVTGVKISSQQVKKSVEELQARIPAEMDKALKTSNDIVKALQALKDEQQSELKEFRTTETERSTKEEKELERNEGRLESRLGHILSDIESVQGEEDQIEDAIREETKDVHAARELLATDESALNDEIAALEEQLKLKREELGACQKKIMEKDNAIDRVRQTFAKELKRVSEKRIRAQLDHEDVLRDQKELEMKRSDFKASVVVREKKEAKFSETVENVSQEINIANSVIELLVEHEEIRKVLSTTDLRNSTDLQTIESELSESEIKIDVAQSSCVKMKADVARCERTIETLQNQIPDLDAKKKVAISSRDFKEASRVSKKMKELQSEKDRLQAQIDELQRKSTEAAAALESQTQRHEELKVDRDAAQRKADEEKYETLLEKRRVLEAIVETIPASEQDENSEEVSLLSSARDECNGELAFLCDQYGWELHPVMEAEVEAEENNAQEDVDEVSPGVQHSPETVDTSPEHAAEEESGGSPVETKQLMGPTREEVLAERIAAVESARNDVDRLEAELAEAIEVEDFEKAGEIDGEISAKKDECAALEAKVAALKEEIANAVVDEKNSATEVDAGEDAAAEEEQSDGAAAGDEASTADAVDVGGADTGNDEPVVDEKQQEAVDAAEPAEAADGGEPLPTSEAAQDRESAEEDVAAVDEEGGDNDDDGGDGGGMSMFAGLTTAS